jgi:hypothetical protein
MALPGLSDYSVNARVVRLAVREESAAATLERIAVGTLSRGVLPWVALMKGSGEPANLTEQGNSLIEIGRRRGIE